MITCAAVSQTEQLPGTQENLRELIMQRLFHDEFSLLQMVRPSLSPWQNALFVSNLNYSAQFDRNQQKK